MRVNRGFVAVLVPVILVGVSARSLLALLPVETLLELSLYDDAFYYFAIAQHIVAGRGSSFDGVNPTNGYHPLWMLANLLTFAIHDSPEQSIRTLLVLSLALDLATALVLGLIAYRLTGDVRVLPLLAAVWLLSPRVVFATLNGMETAASALAVTVAFLAFYHTVERPTPHRFALFGVSGGFAMLARTDNALLVGLLLVLLLIAVQRAWVLLSMLLAAGLVAPWAIWNWITFESMVQDSAVALRGIQMAELAATGQSLASFTLETLAPMYAWTVGRQYAATGLPVGPYALLSAGWIAVAIVVAFPYLRSLWSTADPAKRWLITGLVVWPLLFIAVHVFWRWTFRPHYQAAIFVSIFVPYSIVLLGLLKSAQPLKRGLAVALVPLMLVSYVQFTDIGPLHQQREMLRAAEWLNAACAGHATCPAVGSFNAGVLGFFYSGRVVNLDGVVNSTALTAIFGRSLGTYVEREDICLLADFGHALRLEHPVWGLDHPPPLTVVYERPYQHGVQTMRYVIYHVENSSCAAAAPTA